MNAEKELDPRKRMIALGIAIVIVLVGNVGYSLSRKLWYKSEERVVARMHKECVDSIDQRLQRAPRGITVDQKAEWQNKALQECQQIKESCEKKFKQEFCLLAQKQFQNPE